MNVLQLFYAIYLHEEKKSFILCHSIYHKISTAYQILWYCNVCISLAHCIYLFFFFSQAGMIRTEQEEFFIEPVETGHHVMEQEEEDGGRTHIVYRSAAVKKPPVSSLAADFHSKG